MKKLTIYTSILILTLGLASCGKSKDSSATDQTTSASNAWSCESKDGAIGTTYTCFAHNKSDENPYWTLTLMCTPELISRHSITGLDKDMNLIRWRSGSLSENKVITKLDALPIENMSYGLKGGTGLVFGNYAGATTNEAGDKIENAATWNLLTKIAGVEYLGFKAYDENGNALEGKIKVSGSIPIAAKFSTMGCKS